MFRSVTLVALGILVLTACRSTEPAAPSEWSLRYDWAAGTMPPPHHYEIAIGVASDGEGWMEMVPGYPGEGTPVWRESFPVSAADVGALRELMEARGIFSEEWTEAEDLPVGGSLEWMVVEADGRRYEIPSRLSDEDRARVEPVYDAIRSLVPDTVRTRLEQRRESRARGGPTG